VVLGDPQVGRWHLFHCADCFLFTSTRNHLLPNQAQSHGLLAWPWPGEHPGQARGQNEASLLAWLGLAYFGLAWLACWPEARPEQHYLLRWVCVENSL
jgi:hypothetical protein